MTEVTITILKVRKFHGEEYCEISAEDMLKIFNTGPAPYYRPLGKFIAKEPSGVYSVVDNETGDAWAEEFYSRFIALKWLIGEYEDTDYAHSLDRSRHKAAYRVGGGL